MRLSVGGIKVLAQVEACVLVPYKDGTHNSIFFGHNGPDADTIRPRTVQQAFEVLKTDLLPREARVESLLKKMLSQHQFDALVILHYQSGNRYLPALTHLINYGEMKVVELIWPEMCYSANGVRMDGLHTRRKRELAIFTDADYGPVDAPIKLWRGPPRTTPYEAYEIKPRDLA